MNFFNTESRSGGIFWWRQGLLRGGGGGGGLGEGISECK